MVTPISFQYVSERYGDSYYLNNADMTPELGGNQNGVVDTEAEAEAAARMCEEVEKNCIGLKMLLDAHHFHVSWPKTDANKEKEVLDKAQSLIKEVNDPKFDERDSALEEATSLGEKLAEQATLQVVHLLMQELKTSTNTYFVVMAARALRELRVPGASDLLIAAYNRKLSPDRGGIEEEIVEAVAAQADPSTIPFLLSKSVGEYPHLGPTTGGEDAAADAVSAMMADPRLVPQLIGYLKNEDTNVELAAAYMLPLDIPEVQAAFADRLLQPIETDLLGLLLKELGRIKDKDAIARLAPRITETLKVIVAGYHTDYVIEKALELILDWKLSGFEKILLETFSSAETVVQDNIANYLSEFADVDALDILKEKLAECKIYVVGEAIARAYGKILDRNHGSIPSLSEFKEYEPRLQVGVLMALGEVKDCPQKEAIVAWAAKSETMGIKYRARIAQIGERDAMKELAPARSDWNYKSLGNYGEEIMAYAKIVMQKLESETAKGKLARLIARKEHEKLFQFFVSCENRFSEERVDDNINELDLAQEILLDKAQGRKMRFLALQVLDSSTPSDACHDYPPVEELHDLIVDPEDDPWLQSAVQEFAIGLSCSPL